MAILYVLDSLAGGEQPEWAGAYTDWQGALTAWVPGDVIYMAKSHYQTAAAFTFIPTYNSPDYVIPTIIVDAFTGQYSPSTASNIHGTTSINIQGSHSIAGMYLSVPDGNWSLSLAGGNYDSTKYIDCTIDCGGYLYTSNTRGKVEFTRTTFTGVTYALIWAAGYTLFDKCTFSGSARSGIYFMSHTQFYYAKIVMRDCDMSAYSGFNAVDLFSVANAKVLEFTRTTLPAGSYNIATGITADGPKLRMIDTEIFGGATYNDYVEKFNGVVTKDTTVYRTSGFSDSVRSQGASIKFIPNTNISTSNMLYPDAQIKVFAVNTGTKSVRIELAHDFTAPLTDVDMALRVAYEGDNADIQYNLVSTNPPADPAGFFDLIDSAPITLATSTEAWTNGAALTKQYIDITFPVTRKGNYIIRPGFAKYEAGKVCYLCPQAEVTDL